MIRVGFTGTQHAISHHQWRALNDLFVGISQLAFESGDNCELHVGDCIGADQEAYGCAKSMGWRTVGHPPNVMRLRAMCKYDEQRAEYPYLVRNRHIVADTARLVACPRTMEEELRSGTWSTIRYARKLGRRIYIIWPDGQIATENVNACSE